MQHDLVVQWIEFKIPVLTMKVRILSRSRLIFSYSKKGLCPFFVTAASFKSLRLTKHNCLYSSLIRLHTNKLHIIIRTQLRKHNQSRFSPFKDSIFFQNKQQKDIFYTKKILSLFIFSCTTIQRLFFNKQNQTNNYTFRHINRA